MKRRYASARDQAEKRGTGFQAPYLKIPAGKKIQFFKPKAGVMLLDILPYKVGKGNAAADPGQWYYERTYFKHRGVGANEEQVICPRMTAKQRCPICEHRAALLKRGDTDDEELIKSLAPKEWQLFNVINLKEPDRGVQLWDYSFHNFGRLLNARIANADEEDEWDLFFTLEQGMSLKVGFAEESFAGMSFRKAETIDFKARKEAYDEDILKDTLCLDDLLVIPDYDKLKKEFLQTVDDIHAGKDDDEDEEEEEDDEDEEEETPRRQGKSKSKSRDEDMDDYDEDEEEEEDDDEEEEEEKPRRGSKSKKSKDEDEEEEDDDEDEDDEEEEEDDDDEEDEEEEEKPRRGSKSKAKSKSTDDEDEDDEEEEEDDDEDDDEDEEEEKPRRGRPRKRK